jgi:plasmid stabilization system protein ParE
VKRAVQLLPAAEREVEEAFRWYERQRRGLGFEFLLALDATMQALRRRPEGAEAVGLRTRKVLLRRFPYLVLYVLEGELILVTAVFHGHRDPRRWSDRVREGAPRSEIPGGQRVSA